MTAELDAAPAGSVTELGRLMTAGVLNEFPRLPVHEAVAVGVWLLSDRAAGAAATAMAEAVAVSEALTVRTICLSPTSRSTLR